MFVKMRNNLIRESAEGVQGNYAKIVKKKNK